MKRLFLAAAIVAATSLTAHAQLLVSDDYLVGSTPTAGQYPATDSTPISLNDNGSTTGPLSTLTNLGFVVGRYGSGTGTANFQASTGGLAFANFGATSTGSGKVTYVAATTASVARNTSFSSAGTTTFWLTALVNRGPSTGNAAANYVLAGLGSTAGTGTLAVGSAGVAGVYYGFSGATGDLVIRYRAAGLNVAGGGQALNNVTQTSLLTGATTDNATYALLFKVDLNISGAGDRLSYWVNPGDTSVEANLTGSSLSSGVITDANVATVIGDFGRMNYISNGYASSAFFDTIKLGTTLSSVAPGAVAVPETGTLSLLAAGFATLGGIVLRRRKTA